MFLEEGVDVVILEVGVGGRLDATNCIPTPVVCGVTSLGFDHVELLGHTLPVSSHAPAMLCGSPLCLDLYDLCIKHTVNENEHLQLKCKCRALWHDCVLVDKQLRLFAAGVLVVMKQNVLSWHWFDNVLGYLCAT